VRRTNNSFASREARFGLGVRLSRPSGSGRHRPRPSPPAAP